jgi:hypothetical protein
MSGSEQEKGAPIIPGSPLARVLDDYAVPSLSAGFADRVLAAAAVRPAALPDLRQQRRGRGWRLGRGIVIGVASFGALATAAAATGLLQQFDIPVPSAEKVWASITGKPPARAAAPAPVIATAPDTASQPASLTRVEIVGPIDTPEELSKAFRRIDEVREGRYATRREHIDQRIDKAIAQRRAAGLPVPTPEEEAALRQRVDEAQARRRQLADERIAGKARGDGPQGRKRRSFDPQGHRPAAARRCSRARTVAAAAAHVARTAARGPAPVVTGRTPRSDGGISCPATRTGSADARSPSRKFAC